MDFYKLIDQYTLTPIKHLSLAIFGFISYIIEFIYYFSYVSVVAWLGTTGVHLTQVAVSIVLRVSYEIQINGCCLDN